MLTSAQIVALLSGNGGTSSTDLFKLFQNSIFADLHVAQIGVVTAFDANSGVTVKPVVKDHCVDNNGNVQWVDIPAQSDMPYIPYNGQQPKTGDFCLIVYTDTDYSAWYASGGISQDPVNQEQVRSHSLSNAIAVMGLQVKWTSPTATNNSGSVISAGTANNGMGVSDSLIKFVESWEGFVSGPDDAGAHGVDYWNTTVGYGHVMGDGNDSGITFPLTQATAESLLKSDLSAMYIPSVQKEFGDVQLKQNQFDALVSFAYNLGPNIWPKAATLVSDIKANAAADKIKTDFEAFCHVGSKTVTGLQRRRDAEAAMFISGQYIANA